MAVQYKVNEYFRRRLSDSSIYTFTSVADAQTKCAFHNTYLTSNSPTVTYSLEDSGQTLKVTFEFADNAKQEAWRTAVNNLTETTLTISSISDGEVTVSSHGLTSSSNGLRFIYETDGVVATGLLNPTAVYIRYKDANTLSLHVTEAEATNDDDSTRVKISASGGSGTQTLWQPHTSYKSHDIERFKREWLHQDGTVSSTATFDR